MCRFLVGFDSLANALADMNFGREYASYVVALL